MIYRGKNFGLQKTVLLDCIDRTILKEKVICFMIVDSLMMNSFWISIAYFAFLWKVNHFPNQECVPWKCLRKSINKPSIENYLAESLSNLWWLGVRPANNLWEEIICFMDDGGNLPFLQFKESGMRYNEVRGLVINKGMRLLCMDILLGYSVGRTWMKNWTRWSSTSTSQILSFIFPMLPCICMKPRANGIWPALDRTIRNKYMQQ